LALVDVEALVAKDMSMGHLDIADTPPQSEWKRGVALFRLFDSRPIEGCGAVYIDCQQENEFILSVCVGRSPGFFIFLDWR
jgi:hypothetical protein